jgi:diadenosine tetraphosphate (Ap4A) HIT family hydrolase
MDCPFCRYLNEQKTVIRESANTFTVLSNPRLMEGHLLVIPKQHIENFSELELSIRQELFEEAISLQEIVLNRIADGCDISQHYRPFVPQSKYKVNHLHIHVRPRTLNDELYEKVQKYESDVFTNVSEQEFEKYKKLFAEPHKNN